MWNLFTRYTILPIGATGPLYLDPRLTEAPRGLSHATSIGSRALLPLALDFKRQYDSSMAFVVLLVLLAVIACLLWMWRKADADLTLLLHQALRDGHFKDKVFWVTGASSVI